MNAIKPGWVSRGSLDNIITTVILVPDSRLIMVSKLESVIFEVPSVPIYSSFLRSLYLHLSNHQGIPSTEYAHGEKLTTSSSDLMLLPACTRGIFYVLLISTNMYGAYFVSQRSAQKSQNFSIMGQRIEGRCWKCSGYPRRCSSWLVDQVFYVPKLSDFQNCFGVLLHSKMFGQKYCIATLRTVG